MELDRMGPREKRSTCEAREPFEGKRLKKGEQPVRTFPGKKQRARDGRENIKT